MRGQTQKLPQDEAVMQIYPEQGKWLAQLVLAMGAKKVCPSYTPLATRPVHFLQQPAAVI